MFQEKVKNAENAGAKAVVITGNQVRLEALVSVTFNNTVNHFEVTQLVI